MSHYSATLPPRFIHQRLVSDGLSNLHNRSNERRRRACNSITRNDSLARDFFNDQLVRVANDELDVRCLQRNID